MGSIKKGQKPRPQSGAPSRAASPSRKATVALPAEGLALSPEPAPTPPGFVPVGTPGALREEAAALAVAVLVCLGITLVACLMALTEDAAPLVFEAQHLVLLFTIGPLVLALLAAAFGFALRKRFVVHGSGVVLITGASTGIGRDAAIALAASEEGSNLTIFGGVRSAADGVALSRASGGSVRPLVLDVTSHKDVLAAVATLTSTGLPIVSLVPPPCPWAPPALGALACFSLYDFYNDSGRRGANHPSLYHTAPPHLQRPSLTRPPSPPAASRLGL